MTPADFDLWTDVEYGHTPVLELVCPVEGCPFSQRVSGSLGDLTAIAQSHIDDSHKAAP